MNFELTVAESFDSLGHFISHCISIFLTSNSCECPHRLLDLIVKERDSLGCRGMRILRFPDSESSTFYCVRSGAFRPGWHRCSVLRGVRALPCQRGGIIGRSNFRASSFSDYLVRFSRNKCYSEFPTGYPQIYSITLFSRPDGWV